MTAFDPARNLKHGFEALKRNLAPMLVGAFIINFLSGRFGFNGSGGGSDYSSSTQDDWDWEPPQPQDTGIQAPADLPPEFHELLQALEQFEAAPMAVAGVVLGVLACFGVFFLLFVVVRCFMLGGWFKLHQQALIDGEGTFADLFSGGQRLGAMFKLKLLEGLLYGSINLGAVALAVLTFWFGRDPVGATWAAVAGVSVGLAFWMPLTLVLYLRTFAADRLLVFNDLSPTEALGASWRVTGSRLPELLIFFVVLFAVYTTVTMVSLCFCCFAFVLTVPLRAVIDTALSEGVLIAGSEDDCETWAAFG